MPELWLNYGVRKYYLVLITLTFSCFGFGQQELRNYLNVHFGYSPFLGTNLQLAYENFNPKDNGVHFSLTYRVEDRSAIANKKAKYIPSENRTGNYYGSVMVSMGLNKAIRGSQESKVSTHFLTRLVLSTHYRKYKNVGASQFGGQAAVSSKSITSFKLGLRRRFHLFRKISPYIQCTGGAEFLPFLGLRTFHGTNMEVSLGLTFGRR